MPGRGGSGAQVRFRRSPHLVSYWTATGAVLENYATGLRGPGPPIVHALLGAFDRWRPASALAALLPGESPASLARLVDTLVELTFLQRSDRRPAGLEARLSDWSAWRPAAAFFHCSTRDVAYEGDLEAASHRMRAKARRERMPRAIKRYSGAPTVRLPPPRRDGEFADVVRHRRTWRQFGRRPASLADLGAVLGMTFGVQRWVTLPGIGKVALKSSPSGGARHPIECYVLALRIRGLARGLYHYRPDTHVLERLPHRAGASDVRRFLPGQAWYGDASALVLMTAVFARTRWRYAVGRAYRVILAEAGHVCQTFCLVASWLGLAPFCTMALADTLVERKLGVDGASEAVLYAAGFGTRPDGMAWAPWPDARDVQGRLESTPSASRARRAPASSNGSRSASAPTHKRRNSS